MSPIRKAIVSPALLTATLLGTCLTLGLPDPAHAQSQPSSVSTSSSPAAKKARATTTSKVDAGKGASNKAAARSSKASGTASKTKTGATNKAADKTAGNKASAAKTSGNKAASAGAKGAAAAAASGTAASDAAASSAPKVPDQPFAERVEVKAFISDMAEKHGFDRDALVALFAQIKPNTRILALMNPPKTSIQRSWKAYRPRFLQPVRIDGGVKFWNDNAPALARATAEYGVPSEIIIAIIGIETVYGRNTGNFQVLQALATLGFDYPSRAAYFKRELEEFLLYTRENDIDPLKPLGSYAGAIGTPQFMPGSIRSYATDFDGDGRIDLRGSVTDAIGSVARFLKIHGWTEGGKTHYPAILAKDADPAPLLAKGPKPNLSIADLHAHGITSPLALPADEKLLLVDLVNADAPPDYTIGTGNFYAITRYNRSFMYAMAVIDLANTIREQREQAAAGKKPASAASADAAR